MKKSLKLLSSIFLLLTIMPLSNCSSNDVDISYTAQSPFYSYSMIGDLQQIYSINNHAKEDGYDAFSVFQTEFKDTFAYESSENIFLLNPGDDEYGWIPHYRPKSFSVYTKNANDNSLSNIVVIESMTIFDESLGAINSNNQIQDGGYEWSLKIVAIFGAIPSNDFNTEMISLEFGNNYNGDFTNYINLYLEQTCIGTCYYKENSTISNSWFENYFRKNLIKE